MCYGLKVLYLAAFYFQPIHLTIMNGPTYFLEPQFKAVANYVNIELFRGEQVTIDIMELPDTNGEFIDSPTCVIGNGKNEICFMDFHRKEAWVKKHLNIKSHGVSLNGIAVPYFYDGFYSEQDECDILLSEDFIYKNGEHEFQRDRYHNFDDLLRTLHHEILHCKGFRHLEDSIMAEYCLKNSEMTDPCQIKEWRKQHDKMLKEVL